MSNCKCNSPYTYGESLAKAAEANGGLIAVAPMMPMDACIRCYSSTNVTVNLSKKELAAKMEKLRK